MLYENIEYYSRCSCGAITLHMNDNKTSYSCQEDKIKNFIPNLDLKKIKKLKDSYMCDHCINHYGLDLCGCGSGENFGKCDNKFFECNSPMQVFEKYDRVVSTDSWLRR